MTSDDAFMMLASIRHCLGRHSYAPSLCCDWLRAKWPQSNAGDQTQMMAGQRPTVWISDRYTAQQGHAAAHQTCLTHLARDIAYVVEVSDDPVPWRLQRNRSAGTTSALSAAC